jgi:16S rRNA (uracil1498-N3)-methyltransferase
VRVTRIHVEAGLAPGRVVDLPEDPATHVARVLRGRAGDPVVLFDGRGGEFEGVLAVVSRGRVAVAVGAHRAVERESPVAVTLGIGISRGERMDYGLQKATELGVAHLVPLLAERCVVQLDAERSAARLAHWRRVVVSACEQCGRNRVPGLAPARPLPDWVGEEASERRLVLSPEADATLATLPRPTGTVALLVGPEGGLAPAELGVAVRAGFTPVRLGPRILRTETAVVAALAAIQACWGDLGGLPAAPG